MQTLIAALITFFSAMLPVLELGGSIPLAVGVYDMNPWVAYPIALAGNCTLSAGLIWGLDPFTRWLRKQSPWIDQKIGLLFEKTRSRHSKSVAQLGHWMLYGFLALPIPMPGNGGWTGALIVHVFGMKKWQGFLIISAGLATAGLILTLGITGLIRLF